MANILVKIFAHGFYKVHAGLLIFLFVTLISYCFFIETAGDIKLLNASQIIYYHFIMLITFISDPIMTVAFFLVWLLYTLKSCQYVSGQLLIAHHQFIFYSSNAFSRFSQFKYWFYTQFVISLPFVFYAFIAFITGLFYRHYAIALLIVAFTLLLICASALWYVTLVNRLVHHKSNSAMLVITRRWKKPYFSLFLYHIASKLKLAFVVTKLLSYAVIIGVMASFADVKNDSRVAFVAVLGLAMAHAMFVYQQHRFENTYLGIARNLPFGINKMYAHYALVYLLLLLPETVWLFKTFTFTMALTLTLVLVGIAMLFHSVLYNIGLAINKYLPWLFGLFLIIFMVILFGLIWMLLPACLAVSYLVFVHNYYKAPSNITA